MKSKIAGVALAAVMACGLGGVQQAEAAYVVDIQQIGDDVVATGSGSIDLAGFNNTGYATSTIGYVFPSAGRIGFGTGSQLYYGFIPFSKTYGFGSITPADFTSGSAVSIQGASFGVPTLYQGGDLGTSIDVWYNTTFRDLGLSTGTYVNAIGADTFTLTISAVPLPGTAPLLGAALLVLGGIGYARRRGRVATAR